MGRSDPTPSPEFPSTRWTLVARAGAAGDDGRAALTALLGQYLPAMRSHLLLRRRVPASDADDILQAFMLRKVLERELLAGADRARGKFRSFLLTALDRFALNELRDRAARTRRDAAAPDGSDEPAGASGPRPGDVFDLEWARQVLRQALGAMKRECEASARPDVWAVFRARTLDPILHDRSPMPYAELTARFSLASPAAAANLLVTAHRMFTRNLRAVVGSYEAGDEEVESEIADLRAIVARARGGGAGDIEPE